MSSKKVILANILKEWLHQEKFNSFSIVLPGYNDTITVGYEGSIKYDHHSEGYTAVVSIYEDHVYVDYDDIVLKASDPEFFSKLKGALQHHEKTHANCKHYRSVND